jgi:CubicO group peptidase (beta-lactamase class C family)
MNSIKKLVTLGLVALASFQSSAQSLVPPPGKTLDAADLSAWLDGRVPYALKSGDIAGAVVIVVKDGKVLLQKGYGYADVAAGVPMDPEKSLVRPGSTTKLFTWTAVMQLVEQGKIDLDRDVNGYLDFKIAEPYGKSITMRDLMNHRAGFEEGLKDLLAYDPAHQQSNEQYLKQHPRPMLFPPGKVPAYSNYGAALAGYIVQRVSGEPFEAYVQHHIFQPLGMRHSTMAQPLPHDLAPLMAKGYRTAGDQSPSPFEIVITAPAGGASVTAADMGRFMLANLQEGKLDGQVLLGAPALKLMQSPSEPQTPGYAAMAHGFFAFTQNGRQVVGHGGDTVVFHTEMNVLPHEGVGIFFSFNSVGKDRAVHGARKELFDGFMDRYFPPAPQASLATLSTQLADSERIAGRYQSSRRIEHGFLSALYLLGQTVITSNADGTIDAPGGPGGDTARFREVAPQHWRKVNGVQELMLTEVDGVKTVVDSDNPVAVLQETCAMCAAPPTLSVLGLSLLVLLGTLVAWPLGALLRRVDGSVSASPPEVRRLRNRQRLCVVVAVVWLQAWAMLIRPVLNTDLAIYNTGNDWMVGALQLSVVLLVAAACVGVWAAWKMLRIKSTVLARIWSVLVALALLGLLWVGAVGHLTSLNLNY